MPSVAVISSVFGGYDRIKEPKGTHVDTDFYLFTDMKQPSDAPRSRWRYVTEALYHDNTERQVCYSVNDSLLSVRHMMRAKYYKTQWSHLALLQEYDYIVWVDGSFQVLDSNILSFCQHVLAEKSMAFFQHHQRDSVFEEVAYCMKYCERYNHFPIQEQMDSYMAQQFDTHTSGLLELGCFVCHNHDESVPRVFDLWWQEIQYHGYQDQISMPFVLWQQHTPFAIISNNVYHNEITRYQSHKHDHSMLTDTPYLIFLVVIGVGYAMMFGLHGAVRLW